MIYDAQFYEPFMPQFILRRRQSFWCATILLQYLGCNRVAFMQLSTISWQTGCLQNRISQAASCNLAFHAAVH